MGEASNLDKIWIVDKSAFVHKPYLWILIGLSTGLARSFVLQWLVFVFSTLSPILIRVTRQSRDAMPFSLAYASTV